MGGYLIFTACMNLSEFIPFHIAIIFIYFLGRFATYPFMSNALAVPMIFAGNPDCRTSPGMWRIAFFIQ